LWQIVMRSTSSSSAPAAAAAAPAIALIGTTGGAAFEACVQPCWQRHAAVHLPPLAVNMHCHVEGVTSALRCACCRRHYFNNTDGLIFVVDSMDRDRIGRAGQEFRSIISDPLMTNSAILVFANKQVCGFGSGLGQAWGGKGGLQDTGLPGDAHTCNTGSENIVSEL
jgi:hypothetical protein